MGAWPVLGLGLSSTERSVPSTRQRMQESLLGYYFVECPTPPHGPPSYTWWTFRILLIFFGSGRGKGESEAPGRGRGLVFIENPRRGGLPGEGGGRGACRVSLGNLGAGAKYFFSAPKFPPCIPLSPQTLPTSKNSQRIISCNSQKDHYRRVLQINYFGKLLGPLPKTPCQFTDPMIFGRKCREQNPAMNYRMKIPQ